MSSSRINRVKIPARVNPQYEYEPESRYDDERIRHVKPRERMAPLPIITRPIRGKNDVKEKKREGEDGSSIKMIKFPYVPARNPLRGYDATSMTSVAI